MQIDGIPSSFDERSHMVDKRPTPEEPMSRLLNGARGMLVGKLVSQSLVTQNNI